MPVLSAPAPSALPRTPVQPRSARSGSPTRPLCVDRANLFQDPALEDPARAATGPRTVQATYGDGVVTLAVVEQHGWLAAPPAGAAWDAPLGGWVTPGAVTTVTWQSAEAVFTVIGDGPPELLAQAVRALPREEPPDRTTLGRIEAGWGRILAELLDEGRHLPLLDLMADRAHGWVEANPETIDRWVREKAPTWAPQFVNELLSDRAFREMREWTWQIKVDKQHAVRLALIGFVEDFARDLQNDPATMAKLETFKHEVMNRDEVRRAAGSAWVAAKRMIVEATEDASSTLRVKIDDLLGRLSAMLVDDGSVRDRLDDYMTRTARYVAENYAGEVTSIISETVERWDADEASDKIELLAGKDLQFIRINGTVVGALAGLAIHTATEFIF